MEKLQDLAECNLASYNNQLAALYTKNIEVLVSANLI